MTALLSLSEVTTSPSLTSAMGVLRPWPQPPGSPRSFSTRPFLQVAGLPCPPPPPPCIRSGHSC